MQTRKITAYDDYNEISKIYALSWKTAYKNIIPQKYLDALPEAHWVPLLKDNNYSSYVLTDKGKYIGTSSICAARDKEFAGYGEIASIYLHPKHYNKGYGKVLLHTVINELMSTGFTKIYLWVLEENHSARKFYENNGFTQYSDKKIFEIGGKQLAEIRYVYGA